jgi:hypothetical protein
MPFGATASQHYYAQTLRWDMNDGSAAQNAHTQEHLEHIEGRLVVYVALGSHATYFVADDDITVPVVDRFLGTQKQYDPIPLALYDRTAHAPNQEDPNQEDPMQAYSLVPLHQNEWLAGFQGRWGYLLRYNPASFSNGPSGPPHRSALLPHPIIPGMAGDPVHLRDQPRALHNHAIKKGQEEEMFIPN